MEVTHEVKIAGAWGTLCGSLGFLHRYRATGNLMAAFSRCLFVGGSSYLLSGMAQNRLIQKQHEKSKKTDLKIRSKLDDNNVEVKYLDTDGDQVRFFLNKTHRLGYEVNGVLKVQEISKLESKKLEDGNVSICLHGIPSGDWPGTRQTIIPSTDGDNPRKDQNKSETRGTLADAVYELFLSSMSE